MSSLLQQFLFRAGAVAARISAAAEASPRKAWVCAVALVLLVVGAEAAHWPLENYPGALWHKSPRGLDIEIPQEKAAHITWPEMARYWVGGQIEGNGYYRPLTSWLFVGEYYLFGTNDAAWSNLNLLLHLSAVVAVLWFVALIRPGPLLSRLATGFVACVLIGAPGFADRKVQYWTIGWWPAQPENISLLCTLGMLGSVVLYSRTGRRRYAALLPALLLLGVCFKEMTYVGGIAVCLFLVRQRKHWRILFAFAAFMGALLILRHFILPEGEGLLTRPDHLHRFVYLALSPLAAVAETVTWATSLALGVSVIVTMLVDRFTGRRWNWPAKGALAAVVYLSIGLALSDVEFLVSTTLILLEGLFFLALASQLIRAARCWPVAELILFYLGASWVVAGYPPYFGWYRWWPGVLASILAAIAWSEWFPAGWKRLDLSAVQRVDDGTLGEESEFFVASEQR